MADHVWETSLVQRDGCMNVYITADGACLTMGGTSPEPWFMIHSPARSASYLPLVSIASPELIPDVVNALRSLIAALESL